MKCRNCGKEVEKFGDVNPFLFKHTENGSIMCFKDTIPKFATPIPKKELFRYL